MDELDFDVAELAEHPHPERYLARFREDDPVHRSSHGYWVITRHDDVMEVLRHPAASTDRRADFRRKLGGCPYLVHVENNLFYRSGEDHLRLRAPFTRAFTGRAIARLRPRLVERAGRLVDALDPDGFDLVAGLAKPLPLATIADLLGVPPERHDDLMRWSYALVDALEPGAPASVIAAADEATLGFKSLLAELLEQRRRRPGSDLLSTVATDPEADLTYDELAHNAIFLLSAGHDTTAALITGAVQLLVDTAGAWDLLRGDRDLLPNAVEELTRLVTPARMIGRRLTEPTTIAGVEIDAGRPILLSLAGANRDPAMFEDPDRVDLQRRNARRHLGFGFGPHVCLGAPLAREQVRVALDALLDRFATLATIEPPSAAPSSIVLSYRSYLLSRTPRS